MNNQLLAKTIFTNQLATREQIQQLWPQVTEKKDIGLLLVEAGILAGDVYQQLVQFVAGLETRSNNPAPAAAPGPADVRSSERNQPARQTVAVPVSSLPPFPAYPTSAAATVRAGTGLAIESNRVFGTSALQASEVSQLSGFESTHIAKREPELRAPAVRLELGDGTPAVAPQTLTEGMSLEQVLVLARHWGVSDIHFVEGQPIAMRRAGTLARVTNIALSESDVRRFLHSALSGPVPPEAQYGKPFCRGMQGLGRIRFAILSQQSGSLAMHARLVPQTMPDIDSLALPEICKEIAMARSGLLLVSGAASSGRTSAALALARQASLHRPLHVLYVGSPVEFLPGFSTDTQMWTTQEVGLHVSDQATALECSGLLGADLVVVDGLYGVESLRSALRTAASGRLVIGVTSGQSAVSVLSQLLDGFSTSGEQEEIRGLTADFLRGIVCLQMVPRKDGEGMVPAVEVMRGSASIGSFIRKGELSQIPSAMSGTGKTAGLLMDDSLEKWIVAGVVDAQEALLYASDSKHFASRLKGKIS